MGGGVHFLLICSLVAKIQTIVCFESRRNSSPTIWQFFRSEILCSISNWSVQLRLLLHGSYAGAPLPHPRFLSVPGFCGPLGSVGPWVLAAPLLTSQSSSFSCLNQKLLLKSSCNLWRKQETKRLIKVNYGKENGAQFPFCFTFKLWLISV